MVAEITLTQSIWMAITTLIMVAIIIPVMAKISEHLDRISDLDICECNGEKQ